MRINYVAEFSHCLGHINLCIMLEKSLSALPLKNILLHLVSLNQRGRTMPVSSDNWLEAQLEEARKDYEKWPDWKKKCSRTGEFIRNRNSSRQEDTQRSVIQDRPLVVA